MATLTGRRRFAAPSPLRRAVAVAIAVAAPRNFDFQVRCQRVRAASALPRPLCAY